jgi:putative hydrolase of the HAD superfamily
VIPLNKKIIEKYIAPLSPIPTEVSPAGQLSHPMQCILFDVYGTLFISDSGDIGVAKPKAQQHTEIQQLLEKHRLNMTAAHLFEELYQRIENTHARLRQNDIDFPEVEIDEIWMEIFNTRDRKFIQRFAVEFEWIVNPVYPMPHLAEFFDALKQRTICMGIISNAQFFTLYLFNWYMGCELKHLGFHPNLVFLSYRLKRAKPSIVLFELAAKRLEQMGISAPSVLYVGNDMLNDIYPASTVGFKTALFAGDKRSLRLRENDPRCSKLSSDLVITDLMQLLDRLM